MHSEVSLQAIQEARQRIQAVVAQTPVMRSIYLEKKIGLPIHLKLENLNISGSFKIRGAANALLKADPKDFVHGVVAASAGNHAQGVAHVCQRRGVKAMIFMPTQTPLIKVESTKSLGATVKLVGDTYDDAYHEALDYQRRHGSMMIHAFGDIDVINGQGSIGLELLEQIPDFGLVIVPVGGGGLISGIACAIKEQKPNVKIIGVQTRAYPAMKLSFDAGKPMAMAPGPTIADGIAVKSVFERNLNLIRKYVDDILLVDEEAIAAAIMELMERNHLLAEGAGAASVAALLSMSRDALGKLCNKSIVCVISGGNIDVNLLRRITTRGLIHSGRLIRIRVRVKDKPGSLAALLTEVGRAGANIMEVSHNRSFSTAHYAEVEVDLELETANAEHGEFIKAALTKAQFNYSMLS